MTLAIINVAFADGQVPVSADKVTENFAIAPALQKLPDGTVGIIDYGQSLTHIPTGRAVTFDGWMDLRRYAEMLEQLPIDWSTITTLTTDQRQLIVRARDEYLAARGADASWPWPAWAGDETQPALSLLATRLDFALDHNDRYVAIRDIEKQAATVDSALGATVGNALLAGSSAEYIHNYGLIYLLGVLHRVDPAAADLAARELVGAWEDGSSMSEWIYQWRSELADQRPLTLHEFPHTVFPEAS